MDPSLRTRAWPSSVLILRGLCYVQTGLHGGLYRQMWRSDCCLVQSSSPGWRFRLSRSPWRLLAPISWTEYACPTASIAAKLWRKSNMSSGFSSHTCCHWMLWHFATHISSTPCVQRQVRLYPTREYDLFNNTLLRILYNILLQLYIVYVVLRGLINVLHCIYIYSMIHCDESGSVPKTEVEIDSAIVYPGNGKVSNG